jgi:hypothetical protein
MATRNNSHQNASSAEDLRQVFETAVVEIHQPDLIRRRLPILRRHRQAAALNCHDGREKRAVRCGSGLGSTVEAFTIFSALREAFP